MVGVAVPCPFCKCLVEPVADAAGRKLCPVCRNTGQPGAVAPTARSSAAAPGSRSRRIVVLAVAVLLAGSIAGAAGWWVGSHGAARADAGGTGGDAAGAGAARPDPGADEVPVAAVRAQGDGSPEAGCDHVDVEAGRDDVVAEGRPVQLWSTTYSTGLCAPVGRLVQVAGPVVDVRRSANGPASYEFTAPDVPDDGSAVLQFAYSATYDGGRVAGPDIVNVTVLGGSGNHAPVPRVPGPFNVPPGGSCMADARDSIDPDGDLLTFSWVQVAGTPGPITWPNNAEAYLWCPPAGQTIVLQVTVSDGVSSATASISYTGIANRPFTVDAGPDQSASVGIPLRLQAQADDPDLDGLSFTWTMTPTEGARLTDATTSHPTLTAAQPGTYTLEVHVSDGSDAATDEVVVTVA